MASRHVECIYDSQDLLGECPLWVANENLLYWIDIRRPSLSWINLATKERGTRQLPKLVGAIVERNGGGLLMVFRSGLAALSRPDGEIVFLPLNGELGEERFNDAKCDSAGRLWVGTLDRQLTAGAASLCRIDAARHCERMDAPFTVGNGIAWSPDSKTMYFTDTRSRTIYAYDFDAYDGLVANRRVFVRIENEADGRPDGCTMDAEGFLWSAMIGGGCIRRFDPAGRLAEELRLPIRNPTSCCFGGAGLSTIFITSANHSSHGGGETLPLEGGLFAADVGVSGMPTTPFAG